MFLLKICFWFGVALVVYTFFFYPLAIALIAKIRPRALHLHGEQPQGVSIVISARNEEANIYRRLTELTELLGTLKLGSQKVGSLNDGSLKFPGEVILISDGSTDETVAIAQTFADRQVRVIDWQQNRGKAAALNYGVSLAEHEVVAFADARQRWSNGTLEHLLACFRDPKVGAVSGQLMLEEESGVLAGVGMYWKFEKWLRRQESTVHSQMGVTGAICAVRQELFCPIPEGILLDDVYWPMQVAMNNRRVISQPLAKAYDRLPQRSSDELRRKLRTLVGNFQLMAACPGLLLPWKNPVWLQFISHKAMRLVTPWALLLMLITSGLIGTLFYQIAFGCQLVGLAAGVIGMTSRFGAERRFFSAAGSFLLLHFAAWLAFWYWSFGRSEKMWGKSSITLSPSKPSGES